jgi:hypothetical protein
MVGERAFRIKVRGVFERLSEQQRADLLARADEHDPLRAAFTPEGQLTYELAARPFFTFRFAATGDTEADLAEATRHAKETAAAWLTERGLAFRLITTTAEDLSQAPLGKRGRRAQRDG